MEESTPGTGEFDLAAGSAEHYSDADLYDHEYRRRREDVKFYRGLADRYFVGHSGEVLELACGSGRITRELLRAGHSVVGLDASAPMLRRATARIAKLGRAAKSRCQLFQADMTDFALSRRFPLAIMGFNSFEHLYDFEQMRRCLDCVRKHIARDGLLVFDVQNPDPKILARSEKKRWGRTKFKHPGTGETTFVSSNAHYDRKTQIEYVRFYYESGVGAQRKTKVVRMSQRRFYPRELELILERSGFEVFLKLGEFNGQMFESNSRWQILHCRPK